MSLPFLYPGGSASGLSATGAQWPLPMMSTIYAEPGAIASRMSPRQLQPQQHPPARPAAFAGCRWAALAWGAKITSGAPAQSRKEGTLGQGRVRPPDEAHAGIQHRLLLGRS
jgi:hypothetical protein